MPLDNAPALQRCGKTTSRFRLSRHVCPEPVLAKQCSAHIGQLKTRVVSVSAAHRDLPERQTAHDRQHDDDRRGLLHPRVRCATTKHQNAPSRSSDPQLRSSAKTGSGRAHEKLPELTVFRGWFRFRRPEVLLRAGVRSERSKLPSDLPDGLHLPEHEQTRRGYLRVLLLMLQCSTTRAEQSSNGGTRKQSGAIIYI